jgi:hypothetical protein
VGGELELLVAPLGGPEVARDDATAMDAPQVADHEVVASLGLVRGSLAQAKVPLRVLIPRVPLEVRVLLGCVRLDLLPATPEDVPPGVDEASSMGHRLLVDHVRGPGSSGHLASPGDFTPPKSRFEGPNARCDSQTRC